MELALEAIERVSAQRGSDRALLEAVLSGYVAAKAYSEIEAEVSNILRERFLAIQDVRVSEFINNTYGKGQGRLKKSDIADLVSKFGEDCKDFFNCFSASIYNHAV